MATLSEIKQRVAHNTTANQVEKLMADLVNATNVMGSDKAVAEGIFAGLASQHPTLQQSFFRAFALAMQDYAEIHFDDRNKASVLFAQKMTEDGNYFPFI